jgi:hypothetical protein
MNKKNKLYMTPTVTVLEVKTEGSFCKTGQQPGPNDFLTDDLPGFEFEDE